MGMSSLGVAVSGLHAAQTGLFVTGHNISNTNTPGYVRQQHLQNDFMYRDVGWNAYGTLQIGLGTDITYIRQIRDTFLDVRYRASLSKRDFYSAKVTVGKEIETIIGELQSDYKAQDVIMDMWDALSELSKDLGSIETRQNFINTCVTFLNKINNVHDRLLDYQYNLDQQIRAGVHRVNELLTQVHNLNNRIVDMELAGEHPNDYRDQRNLALDELASYLNISYRETPGGRVDITVGGYELLAQGTLNRVGLQYCGPNNSFVEPVLTNATEILPYDEVAIVYRPLYRPNQPIDSALENDRGSLLGLMVGRGYAPANHTTEAVSPNGTMGPVASMYAPTDVTQYPLGMGTVDPAFWTDYAAYAAAYSAYTAQLGSTAAEVFPPVPPDPNDPKYTHPATGGDWGNFVADYNTYMNTIYNQYVADYKIAYNQYQKRRFDTMQSMIPRAQREFDLVVNKIVTLINDTFSPVDAATGLLDVANAPRDQRDTPTGLEIFVRKYPPYSDRYDPATGVVNPENPNDIYSLYAMGNLIINPLLSNSDGYAKLPLSRTGDVDDNNLVNDIMEIWKSNEEGKAIFFEYMDKDGYWIREWVSVDKAYQIFVSHTGTDTAEAQTYVDAQTAVVVNLDNKRQAISGVSLDEELANMLTFQHAYNASARVVNEVDSMLDRIINRVGRVGL